MIEATLNSQKGIGPDKWKEKSYQKIRKINQQIENIENAPWHPQRIESTLVNKEICASLSNQEALKHSRGVRNIVLHLQEAIVQNNEEIKRLQILKQSYEKYLYNIKVDQTINRESKAIRSKRPQNEREISDGADDLLEVEKTQLVNIKYHLETILKSIQEHLLNINQSRKELINVQKERNRVLDLLCQRGSVGQDSNVLSRGSSRNSLIRSTDCINLDYASTDPFEAFTPSCKDALRTARNFRMDSEIFRDQLSNNLEKIQNYRHKSSRIVNSGFLHKMSETEQIKNQLQMARIRARSASNRARRWCNYAEKSMEFNQGPQKYQDLLVRERLDRPVIKIFQRHPGTQLPEAQELISNSLRKLKGSAFLRAELILKNIFLNLYTADNKLRTSMIKTNADINHLQALDAELYKDIISKSRAINVDKSTLRWRRFRSLEMHCK